MKIVTSFHPDSWNVYAKKCVESFLRHWPNDLICYVEDKVDFEDKRVIFRNINDIEVDGKSFKNFIENLSQNPLYTGIRDGRYNYNYDLVRFSKKVFAQYDVLKDAKEKVIWLDADTVTIKDITQDFLESLFDGKGLCYLGRSGFHTETGFVGFDPLNESFGDFLDIYIGLYLSGHIVRLSRWHDCEAFDTARLDSGISGHNLTPFFNGTELHVFPDSILGKYIVHNKGNRKYG